MVLRGDRITEDVPRLYETEDPSFEKKIIHQGYRISQLGFYWPITELDKKKMIIEQKLGSPEDLTSKIDHSKENYTKTMQQEKELAIKLAQLQTRSEGLQKQQQQLQKTIDQLKEEKAKLIRLKEIYRWLEQYFLTFLNQKEL